MTFISALLFVVKGNNLILIKVMFSTAVIYIKNINMHTHIVIFLLTTDIYDYIEIT